jgi:prepilin-type N-terminal cleavage/methylation domain-containing protein
MKSRRIQGCAMNANCKRRRGFSLLEVLGVVIILGIVVTIAVPMLLSARRAGLDEKARNSLRSVVSAQQCFFADTGRFGSLSELTSNGPPYLDSRFSAQNGQVGEGIEVQVTLKPGGSGFQALASNPAGNRDFVADESFSLREQ